MATTTSTSRQDGEPDEQTPSSPARRSFGHTLARIARVIGFAALMAGLGYGGGRLHARLELGEFKAQAESAAHESARSLERTQAAHREALAAARTTGERADSERARVTDLALLYEGYRIAQHALDALDAHNFGIAESELRAAQQMLTPLSSRLPDVAPLLTQLGETKVVVSENLASQREAIASLVKRLDQLITTQRASLPPPAP